MAGEKLREQMPREWHLGSKGGENEGSGNGDKAGIQPEKIFQLLQNRTSFPNKFCQSSVNWTVFNLAIYKNKQNNLYRWKVGRGEEARFFFRFGRSPVPLLFIRLVFFSSCPSSTSASDPQPISDDFVLVLFNKSTDDLNRKLQYVQTCLKQ